MTLTTIPSSFFMRAAKESRVTLDQLQSVTQNVIEFKALIGKQWFCCLWQSNPFNGSMVLVILAIGKVIGAPVY